MPAFHCLRLNKIATTLHEMLPSVHSSELELMELRFARAYLSIKLAIRTSDSAQTALPRPIVTSHGLDQQLLSSATTHIQTRSTTTHKRLVSEGDVQISEYNPATRGKLARRLSGVAHSRYSPRLIHPPRMTVRLSVTVCLEGHRQCDHAYSRTVKKELVHWLRQAPPKHTPDPGPAPSPHHCE